MTLKERTRCLLFLTEKMGRVVAGCDLFFKAAIATQIAATLIYYSKKPRVTLAEIKRADAEIEHMAQGAITRAELQKILCGLEKEFGFGRLAEDPVKVLRRVIKRGKIVSSDEQQLVMSVLSYVGDDGIPPMERSSLERIFQKFNKW